MIIAEIGINHDGDYRKAVRMIRDAHEAGCKVVKFQCHIPSAEMTPKAKEIIPSNATENIYDMMVRCSLSEDEDRRLKSYTESLGMTYLCTPFSREAVDRLERIGVSWYKIGSGECNNHPLVDYIASKGKPVILSTGMNDFESIDQSVDILKKHNVDYSILHCVSMYPTPYDKVNLGRILELKERYHVEVGLSDHSIGIYTALGAVALGAGIIEKHFVSDRGWPGPDVSISLDPRELRELIVGAAAIEEALGSGRDEGEQRIAEFAFASVVATKSIHSGESLNNDNTWVKRPGTGMIPAADYNKVLGRTALRDIPKDAQLEWEWLS